MTWSEFYLAAVAFFLVGVPTWRIDAATTDRQHGSSSDDNDQKKIFNSLSKLSEIDKNALWYNSAFQNYQRDHSVDDSNIPNINETAFVKVVEQFIAGQPPLAVLKSICKSTSNVTENMQQILSQPLFTKMQNKFQSDFKLTDLEMAELLNDISSRINQGAVDQLCAEHWMTTFANRALALEPITVKNQLLDVPESPRVVLFGASAEFEVAAVTYCLAWIRLRKQHNTVAVCRYQLAPSRSVVELNARVAANGTVVEIWLEHSTGRRSDKGDKSDDKDGESNKNGKGKKPLDLALLKLVEDMWAADEDNRLPESDVQLNFGSKADPKTDVLQQPLIKKLNETIFQRPVYKTLIDIWDKNVFHPRVCTAEKLLIDERLELINKFVTTVTDTNTFKLAYEYLKNKGIADTDVVKFRTQLVHDWFGSYTRCHGPLGSSGFEHVFCGEERDQLVDGHHNWINYWRAQKAGQIEYLGFYTFREKNIVTIRYRKNGFLKAIGGFLFRTSPAFDFSLFTVCYLSSRGNEACHYRIAGDEFFVTSLSEQCTDGYCIATTYPGTHLTPYAVSDDEGNNTSQGGDGGDGENSGKSSDGGDGTHSESDGKNNGGNGSGTSSGTSDGNNASALTGNFTLFVFTAIILFFLDPTRLL